MTCWTLIRRSLRFHARAHLGAGLGAAIGSAALTGALLVGDSVRETLRQRALQRLANASFALAPVDRLFTLDLEHYSLSHPSGAGLLSPGATPAARMYPQGPPFGAALLALPGTVSRPSGGARANHVQVFGVGDSFWSFVRAGPLPSDGRGAARGTVFLNQSLAAQLGVHEGDEVILRVQRPAGLSLEAAVTQRRNQSVALRLKMRGVVPPEWGGDLNLNAGAAAPLNAFVGLDELSTHTGLAGKANLFLSGAIRLRNHARAKGLAGLLLAARQRWDWFVFHRAYWPPPQFQFASTYVSLKFLTAQVQHNWTLQDADLKLDYASAPWGIELRSPRVFLEPPVVAAATRIENTNATFILTYLANLIAAGSNATPYSMVTAAGPPFTPAGMGDDEIVVNQWLADDLQIRPGDTVDLSYFLPESGVKLTETTNHFHVHSIVPLEPPWADRTLMPDFPGIEKAESTRDWDAGFPLMYKIRPKDEQYWKERRGTPKAFVTLAAGQKMWANRFGQFTAVRFADPPGMPTAEHWGRFKDKFLATLKPEEIGLRFEPVREQALKAAEQSQDFGQLFLGFSIFLVVAALLLMALLFQFGLEQRAAEVGTLLALGFTARQVRRLFLGEGAALALAGGILGTLGGLGYARAMLWGLATVWRGAVGSSTLRFHATELTLITGLGAGSVVGLVTVWLTLRAQAARPARELLAGEVHSPVPAERKGQSGEGSRRRCWVSASSLFRPGWVALVAGLGAAAILAWALLRGDSSNAGAFFGAGVLLLLAGLGLAGCWLGALARKTAPTGLTLAGLGVRGCARRRKRSLATAALLACGCFVIVAIGVFRLDANRDATERASGTGGFALVGDCTIPVVQDLNTRAGREFFGLGAGDLPGVRVVPFRVLDGDEASCLNLYRAQKPRLIGVQPGLLAGRFTFTRVANGLDRKSGWELLTPLPSLSHPMGEGQGEGFSPLLPLPSDGRGPGRGRPFSPQEVPAIGDANSIQWALGKKVGDTIDYTDEYGHTFKLRLVGAVANSILQGNLIVDEAELLKRFPSQSGHRLFLIDAPPLPGPLPSDGRGERERVAQVEATLSRAMQDVGLELTPAVEKLKAFNAVQNTYLGTFQVLGGLGLLLGSAGLGVVVLRNVLERRGELGLLLAVGFRRRALQVLVLSEHGALLGLGLGIGIIAAAVAVLPALLSPATRLPYTSLALTLSAVLINGAVWTGLATRRALRGDLLEALRNE